MKQNMVSDSVIAARLREILRESDLDTATPSSIRRKLQEEFGVDLSDRKTFIRDQIDLYLHSQMPKVEEEENANQTTETKEEADDKELPENDVAEEEEEEEEDEEEEEEVASGGKRKAKKGSNKVDKDVKKKRGGGGFTKLCSLSPQLQKFVGEPELARTEVVRKLWAYIRENNLQDPNNKRNILCDESLEALFCVKSINMFKMNKYLCKHIWPLASGDETVKQAIKAEESSHSMSEAEVSEEEEVERKRKVRRKGGRSAEVDKETKKRGGFTKLCSLSPELQKFTGSSELARTEVVKKIWAYIKEKDLQDPKNKRNILCDKALHPLFQVDSIDMFKMNKALSEHIRPLKAENVDPGNSSQSEKPLKQESEALNEPEQKEKRPKDEGSV